MKQKSETLQLGIQFALILAMVISASAGVWCIRSAQPRPDSLRIGAIMLALAFLLLMCLLILRKLFYALKHLEESMEGWSNTQPEALEEEMSRLPGPAGELGQSFYKQMQSMEEKLSHVEESAIEKADYSAEQRIVREIRDLMLPRVLEDYPNRKNFKISGIVEDAAHPGSTYFDYFFIDPGLLCFSLAQLPSDGSILQMVMAQTMLRGRLWMGRSLSDAMSDVNSSLFDYGSTTQPVSMLAATLNTWSGQVSMVNAGLPQPMLMLTGEGYEQLDLTVSISLGQMSNVSHQSSEFPLRNGSRLFLFTEGLGSMTNRDGLPFREQELRTTLNRSRIREEAPEQTLLFLADEAKAYCDTAAHMMDFSALLLEFRKTDSNGQEHTVSVSAESVSELLNYTKTRLQENDKRPREYAPLVVMAEELFTLCCRRCRKGSSMTLSCSMAPDTKSFTLRLQAPFGGKNPLESSEPGPDAQAADYITRQAEYVDYQAGNPNDTLTVVWFFS